MPDPYIYQNEAARQALTRAQLLTLRNAKSPDGEEDYDAEINAWKSVLAMEPGCTDPQVFAFLGEAFASVDLEQCTPYLEKAIEYNSRHQTLDDNKPLMHMVYKHLGVAYLAAYRDRLNEIDETKFAHYYREALRYQHDDRMAATLAKTEQSIARKQGAHLQPKTGDAAASGGCFIATAAFGSAMAPEVAVFRRFRDDTLAPSIVGSALIRAYYRISPPLARRLERRPALRRWVRAVLRVLAKPGL